MHDNRHDLAPRMYRGAIVFGKVSLGFRPVVFLKPDAGLRFETPGRLRFAGLIPMTRLLKREFARTSPIHLQDAPPVQWRLAELTPFDLARWQWVQCDLHLLPAGWSCPGRKTIPTK